MRETRRQADAEERNESRRVQPGATARQNGKWRRHRRRPGPMSAVRPLRRSSEPERRAAIAGAGRAATGSRRPRHVQDLPDAPHRYFKVAPTTEMVPVAKLVDHPRSGVGHRARLRAHGHAFNGEGEKRDPICGVEEAGRRVPGRGRQLDTAIAREHGWTHLPVNMVRTRLAESHGAQARKTRTKRRPRPRARPRRCRASASHVARACSPQLGHEKIAARLLSARERRAAVARSPSSSSVVGQGHG